MLIKEKMQKIRVLVQLWVLFGIISVNNSYKWQYKNGSLITMCDFEVYT